MERALYGYHLIFVHFHYGLILLLTVVFGYESALADSTRPTRIRSLAVPPIFVGFMCGIYLKTFYLFGYINRVMLPWHGNNPPSQFLWVDGIFSQRWWTNRVLFRFV